MSTQLQVVYADMLAASHTFETQSNVFYQVTENGANVFQGACDANLYQAMLTFFNILSTGQQTIASAIYGHGEKLRIAHDNYDTSEKATTTTISGLYRALLHPDDIE